MTAFMELKVPLTGRHFSSPAANKKAFYKTNQRARNARKTNCVYGKKAKGTTPYISAEHGAGFAAYWLARSLHENVRES